MQFIRQNLFLVILSAAFVIAGVLLLVLGLNASSNLKTTRIEPAQSVWTDIQSMGGKIISQDQINEMRITAMNTQKQAKAVTDLCVNFNRAFCPVLSIKEGNQITAAFPVPEGGRYAGTVYYQLIDSYLAEMEGLLHSLEPTTLPTSDEITRKTKDEAQRLTDVFQEYQRRETEARKDNPEATVPIPPVEGLDEMVRDKVSPEEMGKRLAIQHLTMQQARKGKVYVDPNRTGGSLKYRYTNPDYDQQSNKLYSAQCWRWVQGDIVGAVVETNKQANAKDVLSAAVKRIVRINVDESLFTGGAPAQGGPGMGAGGSTPPQGMPPPPSGESKAGLSDPSFTQHACSKSYDVIRYDFEVIMPARHIRAFQSNLMRRNLHTILKVEILKLDDETSGAAGGAGGSGSTGEGQVPYYYGTDTVMRIRFYGELLLLTAWERGTYDSTNRKWVTPPLMPVAVLKTLPPDALRQEDTTRIAASK